MNNGLFAPFSQATREVFKLLLDLDASTGNPQTLDSLADSDDDIHIAIGITGDLSGEIYYRFPRETTLKIVTIMSGMEIKQVDDFVTSALGEIANIISGNAMTNLSEQKILCDILPPRVLDANEQIAPEEHRAVTVAQVKTSIGDVDLGVHIKPKAP